MRHWGPLWVAGKSLGKVGPGKAKQFDIAIAGGYVLEAAGAVEIDGRMVSPRGVVALSPGKHRIKSKAGAQKVVLRHAAARAAPRTKPPRAKLFDNLRFRQK